MDKTKILYAQVAEKGKISEAIYLKGKLNKSAIKLVCLFTV